MIRLLLVFAGAGAGSLLLADRLVARVSRRSALVLMLLPLLLTGRAVSTGSYYGPLAISYTTPPLRARGADVPVPQAAGRLSDVQVLNVPWLKAVRESVKHGRVPFLNRFILCGDSLLGTFQPMVFHPATVIGFLLPLATAWTFACAFHLFLAALFAFLFFREIGGDENGALFGAAAWMLSNFMVFWVGWDIAPAFAPFPLLLLGLHRIARGARGGLGIAAAALTLALLAGHPETVLHETAAAGLFFLFELRAAAARGRAIVRALAAGVLALGLSGPALFPFLEAVPQSFESVSRRESFAHEPKSTSWRTVLRAGLVAVDADVFGSRWNSTGERRTRDQEGVFAGAGAFVLALAAAGFFSRRREKWIFAAVGALAFTVAVGMPGISDVVGRLPLFDIALNGRLAGIAAFCTVTLAVLGLEAWRDPRVPGPAAAMATVAAVRLAIGLLARGSEVRPADAWLQAAVSVVPIVVCLAIAGSRRTAGGLASAAIVLLLLFRLADVPALYPTYPARLFYPRIPEISRLPPDDVPYRTVGLDYSLPPNQSALYELEDPRGYTSMTNSRYLHLYPLWCVPQPVSFNRVDDPTRPFLSLLGVRFALGRPNQQMPAGWREFVRGDDCAIFENPSALPRAFAPERIRFQGPQDDPLEAMRAVADFRAIGWVENVALAGRESENGRATVKTVRRGTDLTLDVDADAPAWIIVSQTFWRGWRAELDGVSAPLSFGDYAFLAVRTPAGRHRIDLRFRPTSFTIGVASCLLAIVVVFGISRRRARS